MCHYEYIDSKESCICNSTELLGNDSCKPVKKKYSQCQDECHHHLSVKDTNFLSMENNLPVINNTLIFYCDHLTKS